ncbi:MAG: ABC transporter ATP-binding protein [Planctomycetota bacterium]
MTPDATTAGSAATHQPRHADLDARRGDQPVIACQRLTKVFRDFWMRPRARAVSELTLEVRPHEVFGLLGPNGSGKSTTIKMILGLLRPTGGRIAVFGRPPTDVAVKKRIGYLPEESYLYPFLNARETLDYYGKLFGLDPRTRRKRTDELLDMVGLSSAQHRQVREYSKGMQRRIGLAQALINDPDLLILDEPTTGLDPLGTRQVKDLILELGRRGKTVILSSHLLADVEDCVDRMVILYGGKIRAEGAGNDLLENHARTTIETTELDDATVTEIDRVLRERGAGELIRVSRPRQRLEELFLDIVNKAQAERAETSGATHAGETASFLKGDGEASGEQQGEAVLEALTREDPIPSEEPAFVPEDSEPVKTEEVERDAVLSELIGQRDEPTAASDDDHASTPAQPAVPEHADGAVASPPPVAPPQPDVDTGFLEGLTGGQSSDDDDPDRKDSQA